MKTVQLKNGASEVEPVVVVTYNILRGLLDSGDIADIIALYELTMICRNPSHQIFADVHLDRLKDLSLLQANGQPHSSIRNVVLSAMSGEGMDLVLGSPAA